MTEKIITILSNASLNHYPDNKISNFRNKLYSPIALGSGNHEIALLSCSYNATEIIAYPNEKIGTWWDSSERAHTLKAPFAITNFNQLFRYINEVTGYALAFDAYDFVTVTAAPPPTCLVFSKRMKDILGIADVRYRGRVVESRKYYRTVVTKADLVDSIIHYNEDDIAYTRPIKAGEKEPEGIVPAKIHNNLDTFDILMLSLKTLESSVRDVTPETRNKWRISMPKETKITFTDCKESDQVINEDGTVSFTVEYTHGSKYLRKGEMLWKLDGEPYYCPEDIFTHSDVLKLIGKIKELVWFRTRKEWFGWSSEGSRYFDSRIHFSSKMTKYVGWYPDHYLPYDTSEFDFYTGAYRPIKTLGQSQLLVYCDLIHPQSIGDAVAPLLRCFPIRYNGVEHLFPSPTYFPICKNYIDSIHMYIMCENGSPAPFQSGTFTATLAIRKRIN